MRSLLWSILAKAIALPPVARRVIRHAQRTPYTNITSADGETVYMGRWWLFNPYRRDADDNAMPARWRWLPSVRVHHIMRADEDRHLHDHPWNARTIVLRGYYVEQRPQDDAGTWNVLFAGDTGRLLFGQYHRIDEVSPGGVWTLFFTWRYRGTWGFLVDGKKVPWKTYLRVKGLRP